MNMTTRSEECFFLFDGALLHGTPQHAWLLEQPWTVRLYDDLGEQARLVGPLLLPASVDKGELAQALATSSSSRRFACSRLTCSQSPEVLEQHLRDLRYLLAGEAQRYYFRYGDGRAFSAVWSTLTPEQQRAAMGPISLWECVDHGEELTAITPPAIAPDQGVPGLPLRLVPAQWHQVLETGRIGELFESTEQLLSPDAEDHSSAQRHEWTRQTWHWLRSLSIEPGPLHAAVNLAMWQTAGEITGAPAFEAALRESQNDGDLTRIVSFGATGGSEQSKGGAGVREEERA
jgi:hypothetical protein